MASLAHKKLNEYCKHNSSVVQDSATDMQNKGLLHYQS